MTQNNDLRQFVNDADDRIDEIDLDIFGVFLDIIRANYNQAMVTNNDARNVMALYHEDKHNELKKMIAERKKLVDQRNLLIESAHVQIQSKGFADRQVFFFQQSSFLVRCAYLHDTMP